MGQQDQMGREASNATIVDDGEPDLKPGLRERLLAELDSSGIPAGGRVRFLSAETGRAPQSVMRWLSQKSPGLPDLRSLAILCLRLEIDANWILGLVRARRPFPRERVKPALRRWLPSAPSANWMGQLDFHMDRLAQGYDVYLMQGDDMAPLIGDGMPFLVDSNVSQFMGNGIYFLTLQGTSMVRLLEMRADQTFSLRCANERYRESILDTAAAAGPALQILGKVCMAFDLKRF
ncbi:S24 family peptidase [Duganella caerulea]|uniref:S24 family peptidase n=1 Tax=Duganella caerulea TaxID=2885762 RepID=UPI0040378CF9